MFDAPDENARQKLLLYRYEYIFRVTHKNSHFLHLLFWLLLLDVYKVMHGIKKQLQRQNSTPHHADGVVSAVFLSYENTSKNPKVQQRNREKGIKKLKETVTVLCSKQLDFCQKRHCLSPNKR